MFNDEFIKTGLRIIFEDSQTGEAFDTMETSANSIFDILDNSEDDDPFNIRLIIPQDYSTSTEKLNINIPEDELYDNNVKIKIKPEKENIKYKINVSDETTMWKPASKINTDTLDLKMKIPSVELNNNSSMEVNDKNIEKFKLKINSNEDPINLKMNVSDGLENSIEKIKFNMPSGKNIENVKMNVTDGNSNTVKLKVNVGNEDPNVKKINIKVKKEEFELNDEDNDELKKLLQNDKPNQLLINCLNILKDSKKSIDRLIVLIPNDEVLVKTQNIVIELLGRINDDHETLLKSKDKCKELAVNVVKFILDLKSYLKIKFVEFKNDVDESSHSDNALDSKLDDIQDNVKVANLDKNKTRNNNQQVIDDKTKPQMQHIAGNNYGFGSLTKNG